MKYAEFFTGIGGFSLGLDAAGHERVFTCEIDKFCGRVYGERFGKAFDETDINKVRAARIPDCDLWVGGFPCQDLSVAGKRGGIQANRSGLVWKLLRLARVRRPRWIALENVPGLLSSQKGSDTELLLAAMAQLWPSVGWRVLDAQFFGVPQRRRRIFLVGGPRAESVASLLFEPEGGGGDPRQGGPEGPDASREVARCVEGVSGGQDPAAGKGTIVSCTVTARQGKGGFTDPENDGIIAFNPQAGGSQDRVSPNTRGVDALVGSQTPAIAFEPRVGRSGSGKPSHVAPTLKSQSAKSDAAPHVVAPVSGMNSRTGNERDEKDRLVVHALMGEGHDASEDGSGRGTPIIPVGYNIVGMAQQGRNHAVESDKTGTLQSKGNHPTGNEAGTVVFTEQSTNQEASPTLVSGGKRGRNSINHPCVSIAPTLSTKNEPATSRAGRDKWREQCAETGMAVRRLTPTECERLQGFPDGHTCLCGVRPDCPDRRIPPWVNRSKITLGGCGHSACGCKCPDSPRYRALGNAVAVPVIQWLGSRFP